MDLIPKASKYDDLSDNELRADLEKQAERPKSTITADKLDHMVKEELRINMRDEDALSRTLNIFMSYRTLMRKYGVNLVGKNNP